VSSCSLKHGWTNCPLKFKRLSTSQPPLAKCTTLSYFKCKVHVYILANVFSSRVVECAGQNNRKSGREKRRTNHFWVWHQLVPACGRPRGGRPQATTPSCPPQAIHGCHWLPEVAVKAFSINSLSEFQYILSIWPLANTLRKSAKELLNYLLN